jgi:hypothetical protein
MCATGVNEPHDARSFEIARFKLVDLKSGGPNEIIWLAVEATAARDSTPKGSESVLPMRAAGVRYPAVFREEKFALGP